MRRVLFILLACVLLIAGTLYVVQLELPPAGIPIVPVDSGLPVPARLPVEVSVDDPHLRYVGRFQGLGNEVLASWSASSITLHFHGTAVNALIALGRNRVEVILDGEPVKVLTSNADSSALYELASNLPEADHTVTLFKSTEGLIGPVRFMGFQLNQEAILLPPAIPTHCIEVIGDSISAGHGNEAKSRFESFTPMTENAYWTYGAFTARAFDADYVCIAWSGRRLADHNTVPELYDRILPDDPHSFWNFDLWKPDVVLINLGANDFHGPVPDEESWVKAYHSFYDHVRLNYPNAMIYLAIGPSMSDLWPMGQRHLSIAREYVQRVVRECAGSGDAKVRFFEFDALNGFSGYGEGMHPNVASHQAMARKWVATLQADMGWPPVAPVP